MLSNINRLFKLLCNFIVSFYLSSTFCQLVKEMQRSEAECYQQASFWEQKVDGEDFIQTDICPKAGDFILDLGCGTGELSAYLAELVGPEEKIIGVDPAKERIQLAKHPSPELHSNRPCQGVFDAILTSTQTREKLPCLYENLMSNNFRRMAVLKKKKKKEL